MTAARVLVVEDEPDLSLSLCGFLRQAGYLPQPAFDGLGALEHFHRDPPDLLLLDWMLPRLSGLELLQLVREAGPTPVILLTARTAEADLLEGFRAGADDFVPKPFRMREVLARVEAVLRRAGRPRAGRLEVGDLCLDLERRELRQGGVPLELTVSEFEVLCALLRAPGRPFTRLELIERLSGERDTLERTVDSHIKNLRRKLGEGHRLETVYGVGYRYAD